MFPISFNLIMTHIFPNLMRKRSLKCFLKTVLLKGNLYHQLWFLAKYEEIFENQLSSMFCYCSLPILLMYFFAKHQNSFYPNCMTRILWCIVPWCLTKQSAVWKVDCSPYWKPLAPFLWDFKTFERPNVFNS